METMSGDKINQAESIQVNKEGSKPWLFLGVGNVLFNEDPAFAHIYLMIYNLLRVRNESMTFEKLLNDRDELIKEGHILPLKTLIQETLSEEENTAMRLEFRQLLEENWLKYNPMNPGVKEFLERASQKYHIGIIANSPAFLRAVLQEVDIMRYFKTIVISEEVGVPKPNRGIFLEAIHNAKEYSESLGDSFQAERSIIVGDSLDQDIAPANNFGFISVQLVWDLDQKYANSSLLNDETFRQYFEHLKNHSSRRREPQTEQERPRHVVSSLIELGQLLESKEVSTLLV